MKLLYHHAFLDAFLALDRGVQKQLRKRLDELARTKPGEFSHLALKGSQFEGLYKFRAGDWRLLYRLEGDALHFITLGHRSEIYG